MRFALQAQGERNFPQVLLEKSHSTSNLKRAGLAVVVPTTSHGR